MGDVIGKVLPIVLLMGLGFAIRKSKIVDETGMLGLRAFAVNISLSMVLLNMFLKIKLDTDYLFIIVAATLLLAATMLGGKLFNLVKPLKSRFNPFISSCGSFSFVGLPLFTIMYGDENLTYFPVIGLANELFVWVIYCSILRISIGNKPFSGSVLLKVFTSPLVLAIIAGLSLNFLGVPTTFADNQLWIGIQSSIEMLSLTATPTILVLLGYSLNLNKSYIKQAVKLLCVRYMVTIIVAIVFKVAVIDRFFAYDPLINISFMSFLLLPPALTLPMLVGEFGDEEGVEILSNATAIANIISIVAFVMYYIFIGSRI